VHRAAEQGVNSEWLYPQGKPDGKTAKPGKEMPDKLNIKLKIDGKIYPLPIDREQEEFYRRAEKEVNELVALYKTRYRAEEQKDYLAMAALQLAVNNVEMERRRSLGEEIDKLVALDQELERYINTLK